MGKLVHALSDSAIFEALSRPGWDQIVHPLVRCQKEAIVENPGANRTTCLTLLLLVFTSVGLFGGGCGTTQLVELWSDSSYSAGPLNKILVIAFRPDPVHRRMSEDAFVAALQKRNTVAVPSYQLFPDAIPDTTALRQKIEEEGFEGVLVLVKAEREKIETYVPGYTTREEVTTFDRRWKAYVTHYETVQHEGYTETSMAIRVQTDLLLAQEGGRLVWSGTSETIDPTSRKQVRESVAELVASELQRIKMISAEQ